MLFLSTHSSPSRGRDRFVKRLHIIVTHSTHGKPRTSQGAEKGHLTHSLGTERGVWGRLLEVMSQQRPKNKVEMNERKRLDWGV